MANLFSTLSSVYWRAEMQRDIVWSRGDTGSIKRRDNLYDEYIRTRDELYARQDRIYKIKMRFIVVAFWISIIALIIQATR